MTDDTGSSDSDFISKDTTPVISGKYDAVDGDVTVTVTNAAGNAVAGTLSTDAANGTWTFTPTNALDEGGYSITATITDTAGNSASDTQAMTIDTTIDSDGDGVTVSIDAMTDDTGSSDSDFISKDTTPVISGKYDAVDGDVTVTVTNAAGNAVAGTLSTDAANGTWTFTPTNALDEGGYSITATITDTAGNSASDTQAMTIDTTIDSDGDGVTVSIDAMTDDTGSSDSDFISKDTTPVISGKYDAVDGDVTVTVTNAAGNAVAGTLSTDAANGTWTFTPTNALDEGGYSITATITDTAGNSASDTQAMTIDTTIGTPTIDLVAESDSGDSDSDNLTNNTTPTFTLGNIDSDATSVQVFKGATLLGDAILVGGVWTFTATAGQLVEGSNDLTVKVTDKAGNTAISDSLDVTLDISASATISIDTIAGDDVLTAVEAGGLVTITGTVGGDAAIGDQVTLKVNGISVIGTGTVTESSTGELVYSIIVDGKDLVGSNNIQASVSGSDAAGNNFNATSDTTDGRYQDNSTVYASIDDSGFAIEGDDAVFTVSLSQASAEDVQIKVSTVFDTASAADIDVMTASYVDDNNVTHILSISSDGIIDIPAGVTKVTLNVPTIDDSIVEGNEKFSIKVEGVSGVSSDESEATTTIIDNDLPTPIVTITTDSDPDDGFINKDELNGSETIAVKIALPEGVNTHQTIVVTDGNESHNIKLDATAIANGFVTCSFDNPGEGNTIAVTATLIDKFGNESEASTDSAVVDTTATSAPIISIVDDANDDGLISKAELGNDGVQVSVTVDGKELEVGANSSVALSITNNGVVSVVSLSLMANDVGSYKVISSDENDTRTYSYSNNTITWSETVAEGASIDVIATQIDNAGNVSDEGRDSAVVDNFTYTEADTANGIEDNVLSVNADNGVLSNDSDLDGGLTVASFTVNGVSYDVDATTPVAVVIKDGTGDDAKEVGSLTLRADGSYDFAPATNWSGDVPTVIYTTSTGESADLNINISPVADAPKIELKITALESNDESNAGDITQVNGGSGQPGGFDVQNGQIVKVGDGVRVWLTKGDPVPEIATPDSENHGIVNYYGPSDVNGDREYADVFIVHSGSGYLQDGNWTSLHAVNGTSVPQSSDAMKDYIFLSGDSSDINVSYGSNNGSTTNVNTLESISITKGTQSLISGGNRIEGIIHGNGTLDGPNQDDTTIETIATSQEFLIDVSAELTDTDGSETLSGVTLTGIPDGIDVELVGAPEGVELSHNGSEWVISNPDGKDLTDIQLKMTVPQNSDAFTITAKATSTEGVGGDSAIGSATANFVDTDTVPAITVDAGTLASLDVLTDDSDLRTADESVSTVVDFSSAFDVDYGTDGRGDVAYEIKLDDSSTNTGLTASSSGEAISLSLIDGKLVGLTESGVKVFEVTLDADGKVSMTQYEAVSHPDGTQDNEEITLEGLGVKLQVTATDADSNTSDADVATTEIDLGAHLKFADDGVSILQNAVPDGGYQVSTSDITKVVLGDFDFAKGYWGSSRDYDSNNVISGSQYKEQGFTVEALGFNVDGSALVSAELYQTGRGLSVSSHSANSGLDELPGEISSRGNLSEELVFKLEPGHLAFGMNAQLSSLYVSGTNGDTENELAQAVFYRDGVVIGKTENFVANSGGGAGSVTTKLISVPGGFDEVHFVAVDNGTGSSSASNSDFAVQSISFIGADSAQPIASATGQVDASSADGIGDFKLTGLVDDLGYTVTLSDDGHTLKAVDEDNKPVFEIKMSGETGTWDVLQYQEMTQDIQFTVKAVDNDGDSATTVVSLGTERVNSAPELTFVDGSDSAVISEEGLADGNPDTVGDSDTTNNVTATGTFTVSDVDSDDTLTVSLVAPTEVIKSGGVTLVWTTDSSGDLVAKAGDTEIIRVALTDTDGQHGYVVTLSGPVDHADATSEDTASINFGIAVNDGTVTTTENVSVVIEDDSPLSVATSDTIELRSTAVTSFSVVSIAGGFASSVFSEGVNSTNANQLDDDALIDQLTWTDNKGESNKTSLTLADSDSKPDLAISDVFSVGTFTHVNSPVSSNYKSLETTTLTYKLVVNIAGQDKIVTLTADLEHDATPNSDASSADVVRLTNLSSVNVMVDGTTYTVSLAGFVDKLGNISTNLSTEENKTSVTAVAAKVEVLSEGYAAILGNVTLNSDVGADGGVVVATTLSNEDGTLVINADGSYEFTPNNSFALGIESGQAEVTTFTYQVRDADGDVVNNELTITVNAENTAPVAKDDVISTFSGLNGEYYGTNSQINNISDFRALVGSKQPDATFEASNIDYQKGDGDVARGTNLQTFLGADASTLSTDPGDNTDGGIHLQGYVYLEAGTYNFKVTADDGYQITIDGKAVATVDGIQSENTTTHQSFTVIKSGYHAIDMIWWDQGGAFVFQPELRMGNGDYFTLDSSILRNGTTEILSSENGQSVIIEPSVLLANDTDVDNDTLQITSIDNVENGYAYINADGDIVFTPAIGYSGQASFGYTVSDGHGNYDSATASLQVSGVMADQATVSVTVTDISKDTYDTSAGFVTDISASLQLNPTYNLSKYNDWINFGSNSDQVFVQNDVYASLQTNDGNDIITVGGDIGHLSSSYGWTYYTEGHISTGAGDDTVLIEGSITSANTLSGQKNSTVFLDSGNDFLAVGQNMSGHIDAGSGNDTVIVGGNVYGSIDLGLWDDIAVVGGSVFGYITGGSGNDSIWLQSYTLQDWNNNKDNIKYDVANFENIKFKDGTVIGDGSAFVSTHAYSVSVDIANLADGENVTSATIFGVPEGAKLQHDGMDLTPNLDGSYTVAIQSGATTVDNLTVVSESDADIAEFDLTATLTTDGDNSGIVGSSDKDDTVGTGGDDFLVGGIGEDTLLGGAGDDVLFGGDDQVSDTLTGGDGKDIFILNDTTDVLNIDIITDFNAAEDALDLTDLLTGLDGSPGKDADVDAVTKFLNDNVKVTDGLVEVDGEKVANFGPDSNFDSNGINGVTTADSIKVIYNDQEYNINIDG
nr:Ig-like domain-containing protein [Marinomonas sp. UCMA 3892]